jgi:hypothetical protein
LQHHVLASNINDPDKFPCLVAVIVAAMDTNDALRQHALLLINQVGISQKVLAARMKLSEAQFSRWVRQDRPIVVSVAALDGFRRYLDELRDLLEETQRAADAAAAGGGFPKDDRRNDPSGPPHGQVRPKTGSRR